MSDKASVYCQTCPEYCQPDDVYLGEARHGEKLQCPVCRRWTITGQAVNFTLAQGSTSAPWRSKYPILEGRR